MKNIDSRYCFTLIAICLCAILCFGCTSKEKTSFNGSSKEVLSTEDPSKEIAEEVIKDVAKVGFTSSDKQGSPIFVIDESHAFRQGQIEQAIVLERLYSKFNLRDIALEGYLFDEPDISIDWFLKACGDNQIVGQNIAIRLLKEGEISAAECLKLVHPEIFIHKTEKRGEYIDQDEESYYAPTVYLLAIASVTLEDYVQNHPEKESELIELIDKFGKLNEEYAALSEKAQDASIDLRRKEMEKEYSSCLEKILSYDPWTADIYNRYLEFGKGSAGKSIRDQINLLKEIVKKAESVNAPISEDDKKAMNAYINQTTLRDNASITMVKEVLNIKNGDFQKPIAMIIGMGHTDEVIKQLSKDKYSVANITPLSCTTDESSDIPSDMLGRKYQKKSLYSGSDIDVVINMMSDNLKKKYQVVLNEPWFQAKAELYLYVDRITNGVISDDTTFTYEIPSDWNNTTFSGRYVHIDPTTIEILKDENIFYYITEKTLQVLTDEGVEKDIIDKLNELKEKKFLNEKTLIDMVVTKIGQQKTDKIKGTLLKNVENFHQASLIFPVEFNRNGQYLQTVWVKTTKAMMSLKKEENKTVEELLKKALEEVKSEKEMKDSVVDEFGRVQITLNTLAAFSRSKDSIQNVQLMSTI